MDTGARLIGYGLGIAGLVAVLVVLGMRASGSSSGSSGSSGNGTRPPESDSNQQTDQGWGFADLVGFVQGIGGLVETISGWATSPNAANQHRG